MTKKPEKKVPRVVKYEGKKKTVVQDAVVVEEKKKPKDDGKK